MKKILFFLLLLTGITAVAQPGYSPQVLPGKQGIWVLCSTEPAENTRYAIFRKTTSTDWQLLTTLTKPASAAEIKARMLDVWKQGFIQAPQLTDFELNYVWRQVKNNRKDSLAFYTNNYSVMQGVGLAFFDATAQKEAEYTYRIVKTIAGKTVAEKEIARVRFPGPAAEVAFTLKAKEALAKGITLTYTFAKTKLLAGVRIYRGYYLRTDYELIKPDLFFSSTRDSMQLIVSDQTATPKVAYSYYLEPFDAAGNTGQPTGQVNLYNVQKNAIAPSVNRIKTLSEEQERAIRLSWRLVNYTDVVSIEVYKATDYNGPYRRIASLRPSDTLYVDTKVKPVETYYYSILLNGMFETSVQSARVPGMLKASAPNLTPVNNFTLSQQNNIVTLEWDQAEADTKSYQLYRSTGLNQPMKQIKTIASDSAHIRIVDTIAVGTENNLYQYAVRDVNSSYVVGPFSPRRNATVYGLNRLPIPNRVEYIKLASDKVRIIWEGLQHINTVSGYVLYRRETIGEDNPANVFKEIARLPVALNQWTDSNLVAGKSYIYGLRSLGLDATDVSSVSPLVRFEVVPEMVPQADNIHVFSADGKITLTWQNPTGVPLKNIEVFRAEKGGNLTKVIALSATAEAFEDQQTKTGKTYYYFLKTIDIQGTESQLTGPVGIVSE